MGKVTVLVEGYARKKKGFFEACSTCVLIEDNGKKIIVDPGCNERLLSEALKANGIIPKDIKLIFLTHNHIDHLMNIKLFSMASILDRDTIYKDDTEVSYSGVIPGTKIKVVSTPGHARESSTLLVKTKKGVVAVAGDLWWWMDKKQKTEYDSLLSLADPFSESVVLLKKSREFVLKKADFVIPGHGKMFRVPKKEAGLWSAGKKRI